MRNGTCAAAILVYDICLCLNLCLPNWNSQQDIADEVRRLAWNLLSDELPHGTAWRTVEEYRAALVQAGKYELVDVRRSKLLARQELESVAAEKADMS